MPTRKEVSKIKREYIAKKNEAINSKIHQTQLDIYDNVLADVIDLAKAKKQNGKLSQSDLNAIQKKVKKSFNESFPSVMKETVTASRSLVDLNQMYFSTLLDSNRLQQINDKTTQILDRKLGIDENGQIKQNGFTDRALNSEKVQNNFVKEVKKMVSTNPDVMLLREKLKQFVVGNDQSSGLIESYYNTFAKDILHTIDRSNNNIFADELGLQHFYYGGGLIKTSRSFCLKCNGKIFTRDQAQRWRDQLNKTDGPIWNEKVDGTYDPIEQMGGYGCLHSADWITADLAKGVTRDQNKIAAQRNQNFIDRNNL